jgi:hypothetical protein
VLGGKPLPKLRVPVAGIAARHAQNFPARQRLCHRFDIAPVRDEYGLIHLEHYRAERAVKSAQVLNIKGLRNNERVESAPEHSLTRARDTPAKRFVNRTITGHGLVLFSALLI